MNKTSSRELAVEQLVHERLHGRAELTEQSAVLDFKSFVFERSQSLF